MFHKPMLLQKLQENRRQGRVVIGLIGTHSGMGVTYTALMLSFYLGEEAELKTAFLECNQHYDMELIEAVYEWPVKEDGIFSFQNISCYKRVSVSQIPAIFGKDYEGLILDFGTDFANNREEFLRCDIKIVVGGSSEWDIRKLERFFEETASYGGDESWLCFIPRGNEKTVARISHKLKRRVWAVPRADNPVVPSSVTNRFFRGVFNL